MSSNRRAALSCKRPFRVCLDACGRRGRPGPGRKRFRPGPRRQSWGLDRFPAPAVVVFAGDRLAVAGHAGHAVIRVAAVFAGLVASSLVAEGGAGSWNCSSRRRLRWRGGCCGCCRRRGHRYCRGRRLSWCGRCRGLASRTRLSGYFRQRGRWRGIHVIAGVIGDVADLGAAAGAQWRGCQHRLYGRQALIQGLVPRPLPWSALATRPIRKMPAMPRRMARAAFPLRELLRGVLGGSGLCEAPPPEDGPRCWLVDVEFG
jgi:hypothetical protein